MKDTLSVAAHNYTLILPNGSVLDYELIATDVTEFTLGKVSTALISNKIPAQLDLVSSLLSGSRIRDSQSVSTHVGSRIHSTIRHNPSRQASPSALFSGDSSAK
jgi:hypothetical protein